MYHLCNFGRGHYGERLSELFFEFGPVVLEMLIIKGFLFIFSSGSHLVQRSRTFCAILVEGFMGNIL